MALNDYDWSSPFKLEMKVANIISNQAKHGTNFKCRNAQWHIHSLTEKIVNIDKVIVPLLPAMLNKGTTYKKPFKINGQFQKWPGDYAERVGLRREEVGGPFTAVWYTPFDPGKTDRLKQVMLELGWVPTEWNEKKMPFDIWSYRKRLERGGFTKFMASLPQQEREGYNLLLNGFIEKHFRNKSKTYMQTMLLAIGFRKGAKAPSFGDIKKRLLLKQYWPSSPKITEDSLDSVDEEHGMVLQMLKSRMVWSHRRSLLQGLVDQVRTDGKLEGQLNPCATPTARGRHRVIVNIPAAYAIFGRECRSLFVGDEREYGKPLILRKKIKEGMRLKPNTNILQVLNKKGEWEDECAYRDFIPRNQDVFVGGDGAGLELRMLTHYLIAVPKALLKEADRNLKLGKISNKTYNELCDKYNEALQSAMEYKEQLLHGDIHSHNQTLAGLPTRNDAKRFIYSFLYGAGDANLGNQLGGGKDVGAKLRARFLEQCPCIPVLIEWVQGFAAKNGWVPGLDGRKLLMRREEDGSVAVRKALNTLLQAAGSIVMKVGLCFIENWIKRDNLRAKQVIFYHDEIQFTCHRDDVEKLRALVDGFAKSAGVHFKMECPLASDSMIGSSWYKTH